MTEKTPVIPFYQMMNLNVQIKMVFVYDMPKKAKECAILDITKALKENKFLNSCLLYTSPSPRHRG